MEYSIYHCHADTTDNTVYPHRVTNVEPESPKMSYLARRRSMRRVVWTLIFLIQLISLSSFLLIYFAQDWPGEERSSGGGVKRSARAYSVEEKHIVINKQDSSNVLYEITSKMSMVRALMYDKTKMVRGTNGEGSPPEVKYKQYNRTLSVLDDDVFGIMNDIPGARLVRFDFPFSVIESNIGYPMYDYASNNCTFTELNSAALRHGQWEGQRLLNSTCQDSFNNLNKKPLSRAQVEVGLPPHSCHRLTPDNMALSFMGVYRNAILNEDGDAYMGNYRFIINRCQTDREYRDPPGEPPVISPKIREVFSIAQRWGHAMYHSIAENMIRLAPFLDFLLQNPSIKIHIYENTTNTMEILQQLGISKNRIIKGKVHADIVYQPPGTPCMMGSLANNWALQKIYNQRVRYAHEGNSRNTIVIIKRSDQDPRGRFFANHDVITTMLEEIAEPYGAQVVVFSDEALPTLTETQRIFYNAFLVIGPHGAGFTNLMWSQPGTYVIEGICYKLNVFGGNLCFRNLANMLGMLYYGHFRRDMNCLSTTPDDIRDAVVQAVRLYYGKVKTKI